ncbi:RluA family pseudouridine synthase [Novosphingobium sp. BL-52-GroH]|uniref:RluA family pseudouridine synthase n=1 Tax=Novosphingobium sp. BL-52-GroH TaxID=3349877 RepID=UPI00384E790B
MELEILFEDGEALVIDKPGGLPLDRPRAGGPSLEDRLDELKLGFQREPFPVHRLDRDTSGCLLLARNPKALKRFSAAFEERVVDKRYLGILAGEIEGEGGTIELALSKVSTVKDGWRMIPARKGKPAVTHWRKLEVRDGLTLVEFRPETGRTHQIRVHAASGLGVALLGDPVYGKQGGPGGNVRRTMLHAAGLTVPRGEKAAIVANSPMPADFRALGFDTPDAPGPDSPGPEAEATDE